jgi:hypothetical protein
MSDNQERKSFTQITQEAEAAKDAKIKQSILAFVLLLGTIHHFIPENKQLPTQIEAESNSTQLEQIITDPKPEKATFDIIDYLG